MREVAADPGPLLEDVERRLGRPGERVAEPDVADGPSRRRPGPAPTPAACARRGARRCPRAGRPRSTGWRAGRPARRSAAPRPGAAPRRAPPRRGGRCPRRSGRPRSAASRPARRSARSGCRSRRGTSRPGPPARSASRRAAAPSPPARGGAPASTASAPEPAPRRSSRNRFGSARSPPSASAPGRGASRQFQIIAVNIEFAIVATGFSADRRRPRGRGSLRPRASSCYDVRGRPGVSRAARRGRRGEGCR